jgi:uncharacterized protein YacL
MNAATKYALGRIGLFVVVAVPLLVFLPQAMSPLIKLMIAVLISAVLSFFMLRQWREELAEQFSAGSRKKAAEKEKLRAALAGDDQADGGVQS